MKDTVQEKEVRGADILKQARIRILSLQENKKKIEMEKEQYKERAQTIENATRGNVKLVSSFERRPKKKSN